MIEIQGLSKTFSTPAGDIAALRNINLHIDQKEIAGIIGYSAAGKSTLVRCINLLEKPTAGSIIVAGQDITGLKGTELRAARRKIGMIFQHFNLLYARTVHDNIAFPLEIADVPKPQINARVAELLELVGLTDRAKAYPAQLSGGQKQRVGIARALANKPSVLLCDEATSALDPATTQSILALLKDINQKLNLTIMIITHEMQVIKEICDTVSVIEDGQIIESGPVLQVFAHPRRDTTKGFIGSLYNMEVPPDFYRQIKNRGDFHQLLRIVFTGDAASEPIVTSLVQNFSVVVNILAGNIDYIKGNPLGILTLDVAGKQPDVFNCIQYLKDKQLYVEVLDDVS